VTERPLLLGDPRLRELAEVVSSVDDAKVQGEVLALQAALDAFRGEHGFGRAISAPQIGIRKRMIALHLPEDAAEPTRPSGRFVAINPEVLWTSAETFSMWDDCMSFPFLLVRVRRHRSISVRYLDAQGNEVVWQRLDRACSELLQHEIDHLDGILATDRAIDSFSLVARAELERTPQLFRGQVDYAIGE
jgi:peptide deformylase